MILRYFLEYLTLLLTLGLRYGITGCEVFKAGIQNWKGFSIKINSSQMKLLKGFSIKINSSQMKLLNFENWTNGEPQ